MCGKRPISVTLLGYCSSFFN